MDFREVKMALQQIDENLIEKILEFLAKKYPENVDLSPLKNEFSEIDTESLKDHLDELKIRYLIEFRSADSSAGRGYILIHLSERGKLYMRKKMRLRFLLESNGITGGSTIKPVTISEIAEKLQISRVNARDIANFLFSENKINFIETEGIFKMQASGIRAAEKFIAEGEKTKQIEEKELGNDVFIVHGHDAEAKESVARFIEKIGLKAIILHEIPNIGRTIIEKFEDHSNVGFAVVLLTPDDLGTHKDKPEALEPRARQNVIFELGYFIGKLGRERICVLFKENVEIPSDYKGILYIEMDQAGGWEQKLAKEIEAGMKRDPAKLLY